MPPPRVPTIGGTSPVVNGPPYKDPRTKYKNGSEAGVKFNGSRPVSPGNYTIEVIEHGHWLTVTVCTNGLCFSGDKWVVDSVEIIVRYFNTRLAVE
jgi:hypothetical protein